MEATKLPLTKWFLAMFLMTQSKNAIAALELMRQLKPLAIETTPVKGSLTNPQRRDVVWVKPQLVAQIEYRAWTSDGSNE